MVGKNSKFCLCCVCCSVFYALLRAVSSVLTVLGTSFTVCFTPCTLSRYVNRPVCFLPFCRSVFLLYITQLSQVQVAHLHSIHNLPCIDLVHSQWRPKHQSLCMHSFPGLLCMLVCTYRNSCCKNWGQPNPLPANLMMAWYWLKRSFVRRLHWSV